jgi:hypothetical protein
VTGPDPSRLKRAFEQSPSIESREGEPVERVASLPGVCSVCSLQISPGDLIASTPATSLGWRHLKCAICGRCGAWLAADGVCSSDCTAGQNEPDTGSWHDVSCTVWIPRRAVRLLAPSQNHRRPGWFHIIKVTNIEPPAKATTLTKVRVHLQMRIEDAPDPSPEVLTRCAAKAIGIGVGNTYNFFEPEEIAYDIGGITIEDWQKLSRKPPWAA